MLEFKTTEEATIYREASTAKDALNILRGFCIAKAGAVETDSVTKCIAVINRYIENDIIIDAKLQGLRGA